jgi:hypothetical protein
MRSGQERLTLSVLIWTTTIIKIAASALSKMGGEGKQIEVDETFIGGAARSAQPPSLNAWSRDCWETRFLLGGTMISVAGIVQSIQCHLRGEMSLDSFRDWMVDAELELENAPAGSAARRLIWELEAHYAELSDNMINGEVWAGVLGQLMDAQRPGTDPMVAVLMEVPSPQDWPFYTLTPTSNSIDRELEPV